MCWLERRIQNALGVLVESALRIAPTEPVFLAILRLKAIEIGAGPAIEVLAVLPFDSFAVSFPLAGLGSLAVSVGTDVTTKEKQLPHAGSQLCAFGRSLATCVCLAALARYTREHGGQPQGGKRKTAQG
jgi:hypothetical protein